MRHERPRRLGRPALLAGASLLLLGLLPAGSVSAAGSPPASEPQALALLNQAARAAASTPYRAVQHVTSWSASGSSSATVQVENVPGAGSVLRVAEPSGRWSEVFRAHNSGDLAGLPGAAQRPLGLLKRNYGVVVAGGDTVGRRAAIVVEARRRDGRTAARFWIDTASGLLLRRETFDAQGRAVRTAVLTNVEVGRPTFIDHLPPMLPDPGAGTVSLDELVDMRGQGWTCPLGLPGGMQFYQARRLDDNGTPVLQLSFSDGLSTVSIFEEHGRLDARDMGEFRRASLAGADVWVRDGLSRSVVWAAGRGSQGTVYTVLTDAPDSAVAGIVSALPHDGNGSGTAERVGRGLARLLSWVNPLH